LKTTVHILSSARPMASGGPMLDGVSLDQLRTFIAAVDEEASRPRP